MTSRSWCCQVLCFAVILLNFDGAHPALARSFTALGDLSPSNASDSSRAYGVSSDGSVVVGEGVSTFVEAFRWTQAGGMVGLGDLAGGFNNSVARDVSANGSVIAGVSNTASGDRAFRWTSGLGLQNLGKLAGGSGHSRAWGISGDGNVIVGETGSTFAGLGRVEAFRWTSAGMVGLGDLSGGANQSKAFAANSDGSVIVGEGEIAGGAVRAFRWTSAGMVDLGVLSGFVSSAALGVSPDGNVVVGGNVSSVGTQQAFRWTQAGGMVGLGDLPGGTFFSRANGVSADGNFIVGTSAGASGAIGDAFIWDPVNGIRDLQDVLLSAYGISVPSGWFLREATAVSPDGRFIVGYGNNPGGDVEAWLVDLGTTSVPEPSTFVLALLGLSAAGLVARRPLRQNQAI